MHVVWDWNGTLLDDLAIVVESVNRGIQPLAGIEISLDDYRAHYTRPVKHFYDRLLARELDHDEWLEIDDRFHRAYRDLLDEVRLAADALDALAMAEEASWTQSLLSMYPHPELVPLVESMGLTGRFRRIDGLRGPAGDTKAGYLAEHLQELEVDPADTLMIGDTPDDAAAADHVGATCVLVHNGSHHREALEATGAPVVTSLTEALTLHLA